MAQTDLARRQLELIAELAELRPRLTLIGGFAEDSFGPLSERHRATLAELRRRFFPDRSARDLLPLREPLLAVDAAEVS